MSASPDKILEYILVKEKANDIIITPSVKAGLKHKQYIQENISTLESLYRFKTSQEALGINTKSQYIIELTEYEDKYINKTKTIILFSRLADNAEIKIPYYLKNVAIVAAIFVSDKIKINFQSKCNYTQQSGYNADLLFNIKRGHVVEKSVPIACKILEKHYLRELILCKDFIKTAFEDEYMKPEKIVNQIDIMSIPDVIDIHAKHLEYQWKNEDTIADLTLKTQDLKDKLIYKEGIEELEEGFIDDVEYTDNFYGRLSLIDTYRKEYKQLLRELYTYEESQKQK